MRASSDATLVAAMREGTPEAWAEFMARFQPLLETYGQRMGMPRSEWRTCVLTVLDDAAMRWAIDGAALPTKMAAYLVRAASFHRLTMVREATRRAHRYARAAESIHREGVILSLCSEAAVRDSHDPSRSHDDPSADTLAPFARALLDTLTLEERQLLGQLGDGAPRREIARSLGVPYETARKRVTRLCARLRQLAPSVLDRLSGDDRTAAERLLRRLGADRVTTKGTGEGARKQTGGGSDDVA